MELFLDGVRVEFFLWMPASVNGTVVTCLIPIHFTVVEEIDYFLSSREIKAERLVQYLLPVSHSIRWFGDPSFAVYLVVNLSDLELLFNMRPETDPLFFLLICTIDSTLFLKKYPKHILLVQIYVDDIIFGSTNPKLCEKFELLMKSEYKMSMMGELTFFLGLQIKQSEKRIFINQGKYVHEMLKKFDLTSCTPMKTPMAPPLTLDKDSKGKSVDVTLYRGMIGSLLYLTASRPDIMYSTCLCARYQAEPKESHLTAVKRIFRYLKGTPNLGLWYSKDSGFDLTAYSDSDFAGCKIDRKSTTGGCHLLGGKLVSWTSKKQNSVSTSTAEAEYVAAGICCAQVLWLRNQLQDYDIQLSKIPIYCDNTSAIAIANNPVLHSKTKHIEVRYHFIRDHVMNGDIELHFVPTEYQLADLFTKPLDVTRFNMLISELGMLNPDD
ncbi:hypothetical protein OSB04_010581 [Centaurea solstitialis]|uniref:Reverse transcriptase Ty1/copia-type domain-containing protein n=1 Tax=Centaurea solstitialis TaxID=347529 RepID=A0AA38WC42_9ASTR|nr:hypothetical protein OSB04_010581 [Centaurea solstitialis]